MVRYKGHPWPVWLQKTQCLLHRLLQNFVPDQPYHIQVGPAQAQISEPLVPCVTAQANHPRSPSLRLGTMNKCEPWQPLILSLDYPSVLSTNPVPVCPELF